MSETPKLDAYLEDSKPKSIDDYRHKIGFYIETIEKIRHLLPFEIRMNMILIDCQSLNSSLIEKCFKHIVKIIDKVLQNTTDLAGGVIATAE